jgi:uncharacterized protein
MQQPLLHLFHQQHLWLSNNRYIYWQEQNTLILSDLHFGKTGHFRKHGIPVPQSVFKEDLQRLFSAISFHKPQQIIIVGDLFHSHENKEMDFFLKWRQDFAEIKFLLVKGNHDILKEDWYSSGDIFVHQQLVIDPFIFIHDAADIEAANTNYIFSGHIHPGIQIKTSGKQNLRFPCFYFGKQFAILPAFSRFTGLANIKAKKEDHVFAITNEAVIKV